MNGHSTAVTLLLTCGAKVLKDNKKMMFFDHALEMKNSEVSLASIQHDRCVILLSLISSIHDATIASGRAPRVLKIRSHLFFIITPMSTNQQW